MALLQAACVAIVALYLFFSLRRAPAPGPVLRRLGLLAAASFLGEDSVIRAYGFYHYSGGWSLFLDRVPLLVVLIWPVVIDSAWGLARRLLGGDGRPVLLPLLGAGLVLLDASLIEPVAVRAGLWAWTEPGLFAVPPIGILGWAFFAGVAMALCERAPARPAGVAAMLIGPPLSTHALLLIAWWGALRWVNVALPSPWVAAAAWGLLLPLAALFYSLGLRRRVPLGDLLVRVPAAAFFFVLLALHGRGDPLLLVYALAFVPPYLALCSGRV